MPVYSVVRSLLVDGQDQELVVAACAETAVEAVLSEREGGARGQGAHGAVAAEHSLSECVRHDRSLIVAGSPRPRGVDYALAAQRRWSLPASADQTPGT